MLRKGDLPLKERIFKSPGQKQIPNIVSYPRAPTYKRWTEDRLTKAISAVSQEKLSVRRAAMEFDVPKSTLHDHLVGKVVTGTNSEPPKYLSEEEEAELEEFLVGCASLGFAKSRAQVLEIVQEVVQSKGRHDVRVSHGWWESFHRRHPNISIRKASPLSYARVVGSNPAILANYFDLLEQTLIENELNNKPAQIFNLDETGMPLDPSPPAGRGSKNPLAPASGDRSQITVLACCSAADYSLPPFLIFDNMSLKPELTLGEVPGTIYGLSRRGWIDGELFDMWFTHHFLMHAPPVRPLLVLMDGHSSHYQPAVIRRAAQEGVILFTLPPHTSHLT